MPGTAVTKQGSATSAAADFNKVLQERTDWQDMHIERFMELPLVDPTRDKVRKDLRSLMKLKLFKFLRIFTRSTRWSASRRRSSLSSSRTWTISYSSILSYRSTRPSTSSIARCRMSTRPCRRESKRLKSRKRHTRA